VEVLYACDAKCSINQFSMVGEPVTIVVDVAKYKGAFFILILILYSSYL
jgi:hypothetical protein